MFNLSPINKRRVANFKANRRGYWSMWLFLALFLVTLCAELVANDKPLMVKYDGQYVFPVIERIPETYFGGDFKTEADYRDAYVQKLIQEKDGWMIWPLIYYSYDTINYDTSKPAPAAPSGDNWLGTDDQGRDVLARVIYGFRLSVLFGLALTVLGSVVGILSGGIQGYFGGKIDLIFQRFLEVWGSLPVLMILMIMSSAIVPGFWTLLGLMLLFSWTALVGVVRAEFLRARNFEYVRAAKALGISDWTIMRRHVLPNAMVATLTMLPFILVGALTTLTSLDFLGLGLPAGSPSLGELLSQGKNNLQAPWLGLTGFFVMALMLSLVVFIGEAVRDAFDPRKTVEEV